MCLLLQTKENDANYIEDILATLKSLQRLQDLSSPLYDVNDDEELQLSIDRVSEVFLFSQLRALAQCIMEEVPQATTVSVGSGIEFAGCFATTIYYRHSYWCNGIRIALAVEDRQCCDAKLVLNLRQGDFVRWMYSV
jgi:hypothetical protein